MLFTSALIVSAAAFAIAAPAASELTVIQPTPIHLLLAPGEVPESVVNATALGIDIWGDLPDDAVKIAEHQWDIPEGTKAAAWLRAQSDLELYESALEARGYQAHLARRQGSAEIGLGLWTGNNCNGRGFYTDNAYYGTFYLNGNVNHFSLNVARRGLRRGEYLDLLRNSGSDWCGGYIITFTGDAPTGCFPVTSVVCFRLHL
ncbi:hypothetical protein QBC35DRAFT_418001 [Podospora australis]|uniref:Ecp2 effector protein domain-containing protein n=1 Tax=Podospora australis TaxID=1536484 RepID=A0AAN6WM87_9PEZI|nr:hypothetical protein QBC35DRAFT_418001 [Podospora australis]